MKTKGVMGLQMQRLSYMGQLLSENRQLEQTLEVRIPEGQPLSRTLGSFYRQLADFTARFPHAAKSLALSLGFEGLERYLASDLDALICGCFTRAECDPPPVTHLRLLRHGLLGLCLDTMRGDGNATLTASELEETLSALTPTDSGKT